MHDVAAIIALPWNPHKRINIDNIQSSFILVGDLRTKKDEKDGLPSCNSRTACWA
jgi:hypothetical protein